MIRLFTALACCCSIFLASCTVNTAPEVASQSQSRIEGSSLYEEYCANCHRSFNKTTKPHTTASRLRSSIKLFPAMNTLEFLTAEQIDAIASALATVKLERLSQRH